MGKSKGNIPNKEVYQRMNFLYQAAVQCARKKPMNVAMCRFYIFTLKTITKRCVLRMHPHMTRKMCKKCWVLLVPGVTARVRCKAKREKHTVVTCLECQHVKRYMWRKSHDKWMDHPERWHDNQET